MGYMEHTAEFLKAVRGGRGELDAWLECNNEAECRAAILGAMEEYAKAERATCAKVRAGKPRELAPVGTGALLGEQQYCFDKGWKEGAAAVRRNIAKRSNDQGNGPSRDSGEGPR